MDRGAWWATVQGCKESDTTEQVTLLYQETPGKPPKCKWNGWKHLIKAYLPLLVDTVS